MTDNLSLIISIFSLAVSIFSFYVAIKTLREQKEYNRICEMPIPYIFTMNYDDEIGMEIKNHGKGVLFINNIIFKDSQGKCSHSLYDLMPVDINWKNYLKFTNMLAISPNEKIVFICLETKDDEEKRRAREALEDISVVVEYKDVYNRTSNYEMNFRGHYL